MATQVLNKTMFLTALLAICLSWCTDGLVAGERTADVSNEGELANDDRPNFLFAIADDWGWPHAGSYGDPVVKTSTFDRLAREGVLFEHAYVSSPSCTPSRGAILTGQWHWRLKGAANLWSVFPNEFDSYPEILAESGYQIGRTGKAWGPGRLAQQGRTLAGKAYPNFKSFLEQRDEDAPFCFWLGSSDPHRPYDVGSGKRSGMDLSAIRLPACFPDTEEIRGDVADYYFEVQRFDSLIGEALELLEAKGIDENTVIAMTGDHGMPFPRCKGHLYDSGTRVPLAVRWPAGLKNPDRTFSGFVSLTDLAPTFLELAGVDVPSNMTGSSLQKDLAEDNIRFEMSVRDRVFFGKERHVPSQEGDDMGGYPCRAIRTDEYLLIRNFRPDRWPAGTPDWHNAAIPGAWLGDTDNGLTKTVMVERRDEDETFSRLYDLAFGKRPEFELYDLKKDPDQLLNVAEDPDYRDVRDEYWMLLKTELHVTGDPRVVESDIDFDSYPYLGGAPTHPNFEKPNAR